MSYLRSVVVATLNKIANLEVKIDLMNKNFIRSVASNIPSDKSTSQKTGRLVSRIPRVGLLAPHNVIGNIHPFAQIRNGCILFSDPALKFANHSSLSDVKSVKKIQLLSQLCVFISNDARKGIVICNRCQHRRGVGQTRILRTHREAVIFISKQNFNRFRLKL